MKRCVKCEITSSASAGGSKRSTLLVEERSQASREVGGHLFFAFVPALSCKRCGETYFDGSVMHRFDLHVASRLADAGVSSGEAFRFLRKALEMRAADLAVLLDVSAETVSRWETEKRPVDRGCLAVLGALVRDQLAGRTATIEALRALRRPRPLARKIRLDLTRDLAKTG